MGIPKRRVRDSSCIPTMSGRSSQVDEPHRIHMRITCLEMEKARRGKERASAMARVEDIDQRMVAIEAEKAVLLEKLGVLGFRAATGAGTVRAPVGAQDGEERSSFRIRY